MQIIGLVGFIGSGKNTTAKILEDHYGYTPIAFADTLKDVVSTIFGWDRGLLSGISKESREWREKKDEWWSKRLGRTITPRSILQEIGTDVFRDNFYHNIWVLCALRKLTDNGKYVFTDMRFENEIKAIADLGGKIFRVSRGEDPQWFNFASLHKDTMKEAYPNIHQSEYDWINLSEYAIIDNNGSIHDLRQNIETTIFGVKND